MDKIYLSVVIPAYNEEANLKTNKLTSLYDYLKKQAYGWELIIVNDGSTDKTLDLLNVFSQGKAGVMIIDSQHQGKAKTVQTGIMTAKGQIRLFTDLDQSTPITEIEKLLPFINKGYDVVVGSREVKGSKREAEPLHRHIMGKVFNLVVKVLAIAGIQDTQCGFKLFTGKAASELFGQLRVTIQTRKDAFTGAFDVELLFLAQKRGFKIAEVPVMWHHIHSQRVNPIKDSTRMFFEVVRIRWASLTGVYDKKT